MKKVIMFLLFVCLVAAFAACGRGEVDFVPAYQIVVDLDAPHTPEVGANLTLPLTTETVEFTIWAVAEAAQEAIPLTFLHDSEYFQELTRRTGVSLRFIHPPAGAGQENFNLMVAAGDYTDVIQAMGVVYPGGWSQAIVDGLIIDVTDLSIRYAPYYWQAIHRCDDTRRQAFTDDGKLTGFHQIAVPQPPWIGMTTRQDWLDDLGLATPVTFDDWEHALTLFRDVKGADAPLMLPQSGFPLFNIFQGGFNTAQAFLQIDGVVHFGPLMPGFRDYLELMHRWFTMGLIDPDFMARPFTLTSPQDMTTTGRAGLWTDVYVSLPQNRVISPDPNFRSVAVPAPVRYPGQTIHMHQMNTLIMANQMWMIARYHPDAVLFTRFMNYIYSPEGALHANFGIEGFTFNFDETGTPQLTAHMYNHPTLTLPQALRMYTRGPAGAFYMDWRRELTPGIDPDVIEAPDIWASNVDFAWLMPPTTLNAEEGMENTRIMNDVNTHRDEMVVRFITGAESFDNWDDFINTMLHMGIERAIEIQQGALDRYFAR